MFLLSEKRIQSFAHVSRRKKERYFIWNRKGNNHKNEEKVNKCSRISSMLNKLHSPSGLKEIHFTTTLFYVIRFLQYYVLCIRGKCNILLPLYLFENALFPFCFPNYISYFVLNLFLCN